MAANGESSSFPVDSDELMIDPVLEYLNNILMDEGMDDAACPQQVDGTSSYEAIFSSLQKIIADSAYSGSHDEDEYAAYGQEVESISNYHAIFNSFRKTMADSTIIHNQTKPQQQISPASLTRTVELCTDNNCYRYISCSFLNCGKDAIESNGGLLTDAMVSCPCKDAIAQGHKGPEQGNGTFKPPALADEQFSSEVAGLDLSFEDLKLDDVYTSLYVEGLSSSTIVAKTCRPKQKSMAVKGRFSEKHTSKVPVFVDVREVLTRCAEAVATGDARSGCEILRETHQVCGASAHGTGLQRIAYIFSRALAARMMGTGVQEFKAMSVATPSYAAIRRSVKLLFAVIPFWKLMHYFANQNILKAAEGASRLHILDYELAYGLQWPCLIKALADREGVRPLLVITFIEFPQPGTDMEERLDECGRQLAAYAAKYGVPFQYNVILSNKWEDLDAASLQLCPKAEVLIINCMMRLRHIADEGIPLAPISTSARQKLLTFWRSLNPHLLVTTIVNGSHNSPFFVPRFREALDFFINWYDMLDTLEGDIPERFVRERHFYYRYIMNVVACEGAGRVERSETYKQWHVYISEAGFEQLPVLSIILARSKSHVKQHYHKGFLVYDDEKLGWMLMGWKGRALLAVSAWKPCPVY